MDDTHSSQHIWRRLFHGAVRDSLANASSLAESGPEDTRAWERPLDYVASDNQGNVGVAEFFADGAIAAMIARSPSRIFDATRPSRARPYVGKRDFAASASFRC